MVYIDANIILRYLLRDNEEQFILSKTIIEGSIDLFLPNEVMAEIIYVFTKIYNVGRDETAHIVIELINKNYFKLESQSIVLKALDIFASKELDFVDCILCATSRLTENTVETFDKKLKKCINE